jgi:hypothetical protein
MIDLLLTIACRLGLLGLIWPRRQAMVNNKSIQKEQDDKQWSTTNQSKKDKTTSNGQQQINPKRTRRQAMVSLSSCPFWIDLLLTIACRLVLF